MTGRINELFPVPFFKLQKKNTLHEREREKIIVKVDNHHVLGFM